MLTVLENLRETMKADGHPDRFVKQYEFMNILIPDSYYMGDYPFMPGEGYDQYGVFWRFPVGQMGPFPCMIGSTYSSRTISPSGVRS